MARLPFFLICSCSFLQLIQLNAQKDSVRQHCKLENLASIKDYKNDVCVTAYNFFLAMEAGDLESVLIWSKPKWLYENLLESFVDDSLLDSLTLLEKKELLIILSDFTKSFLEDKKKYKEQISSTPINNYSDKQFTIYIKSNLACAVFNGYTIYLQLDEEKRWKAFKMEKSSRDSKIRFIKNKM